MNSAAINILRGSKHSLLAIALLLAAVLFTARTANTQQLQRGISVNMPVTTSAAPMPDADNANALIVTATRNGGVYFGLDSITPAALPEKLSASLSNREQHLYIKADARTPYANVAQVLEAARTAGLTVAILLTSQPESPAPGTIVPPKGLSVFVGVVPASDAPVVQLSSGQPSSTLKINNRVLPWTDLQTRLQQILQDRSDKVIRVRADGTTPFAEVAHVIDVCHSAGAKVILATPEL